MWSYSPFCPKFCSYYNEGQSEKNWLATFAGSSPKTLFRRKNLARYLLHRPSYSAFVPILLPWKRGAVGRNVISGIWWPILKHPSIGAKILQISFTQGELKPILSQILLPWQRESIRGNAICSIQWPNVQVLKCCR